MNKRVRIEVTEDMKLFYDEERKILFIDEIPHQIFGRIVHYPVFGNVEPADYKKRFEVIVPHKHYVGKGETVDIDDVHLPLWCIRNVERIEEIAYEGDFWIKVKTPMSYFNYDYSFYSSEGNTSKKYLEIDKNIPPYLVDVIVPR